MTDHISILQGYIDHLEFMKKNAYELFDREQADRDIEAFKVAIKALEQEPILDKIRAEINGLTYYWCEVNPKSVIDDVLQIIDKYRAESEGKG